MAGMAGPVPDEREGLLSFLRQQRYVLRLTAYGLSDEQARQAPGPGPLNVGGLVKHVAATEQYWLDLVMGRDRGRSQEDREAGFRLGPDETLDGVLEHYDRVAEETEAIVASVSDLGQPVPVPKGVPWFPSDIEAWSVRWVLLHVIEETARHAGHADIVREAVDGATAFPLMAAAEGWPATPWMVPWEPQSV
jgi:uncharacterized damage-inducible protein DinB